MNDSPDVPRLSLTLRTLAATWRARLGFVWALLLGFGLWSTTVTDHIGYVSALAAALLATSWGAITTAAIAPALRRRGISVPGSHVVLTSLVYPLALVTLIALVVLSHGLVAPACAPSQGVLYWLLIAVPGAMIAGLIGLALGAMTSRPRLATTLAVLLVPSSIVWSLVRFYTTPTIFAYDPFYGFYPGAIYDERIPLGLALVTYRLGTFAAILGLAGAIAAQWTPSSTLSPSLLRHRSGATVLGVAGTLVAFAFWLAGPLLGHRHSASDLASALEGKAWSRRCVVHYDRSISRRQGQLTARDCDVRVAQLEDFYGVHVSRRITVFLFANADQKQRWMGAADTYIAKPWRYEVYLQYAPFPHPVLKHELAHVVAAEMAPGFLRIPTRAALLPVPGVIEGAAVAAAWEGEGEATPHQSSRAMLEAQLAPRVSTLTGLGFFASASITAYTAAGSFHRWLHATYGAARFRRLYASGDFASTYGRSLTLLERDWHTFLRTVPVSERSLVRARMRFRRASVFGRQCPYALEDLGDRAHRLLDAGDVAGATDVLHTLRGRDPTDLRVHIQLAVAHVRGGDLAAADDAAREAVQALGPAAGNRVRMSTADAVWRWRGASEAIPRYGALDLALLDEDEARTVTLKQRALAAGGMLGEAMRDLLIGRGELDPSPTVAAARLGTLLDDPVARYLAGRQYFLHERFEDALATLDEPRIAASNDARMLAETRRMIATARYLQGDLVGARATFLTLARDVERPQGLRDVADDWIDRIDRELRP